MTSEVKRNKPSRELRASTHEASSPDYNKLALATMQAIIGRKISMYVKVPYFCKWSEDYPKGILAGKDGIYDIYKQRVVKVANWLHARGYLPDTHKNIMLSIRDFAYKEARINSMLNPKILVDNTDKSAYNDGSGFVEEEE